MEKKKGNVVWSFFASVKLALFSLFILATASIIGTIIPQKEDAFKYVELYGQSTAKVFQLLNFTDMYGSWWFVAMLSIFSLTLTVCTIERFPHLWRVVTMDNLGNTAVDRLKKMPMRRTFETDATVEQAETAVQDILTGSGWKLDKAEKENGTMFFTQKAAWTRLGVIVVHVSILVIFVGSLIGTFFGFKASVVIPEGSSTSQVFKYDKAHTPISLDFKVFCNAFYLKYYDTGAPKEFRSDLTVEVNNQEVYGKSIVVNDPMKYGGLTFYQSSYQPMEGQFAAKVINENTANTQQFYIVPRREMKWRQENVSFGITNITGPDMYRRYRYKIWFTDGKAAPSEFWVDEGATANIKRPDTTYVFTAKPRFATGLQVVKDPGVWTVYIGCGMMIVGLIIIFFMSHRRIWIFVSKDKKTSILISGQSNKNKIGFESNLADLYDKFTENESLDLKNS